MVRWCTWWIIRDFDLAGILCPARNSTTCDRPWCATSDAIRSPHMPHLPDALLPPCSLPAALAYLTLSFPDAVYPVSVFSTPL